MRHRASTDGRAAISHAADSRTGRARGRGRVIAAIVAAAAVLVVPVVVATSAQAAVHTFLIDSLDASVNAKDANTGDGVCATVADTCTMRAALEESNALNLPKGSILITVADGFTGNIDPQNALNTRMMTTAVSAQDAAAHFMVTAPVTIDLRNQVTMETSIDTTAALMYVNGSDIEFKNVSQMLAGESSFVMGTLADGVLIDGGSSVTQAHYGPERFVTFREGSKNITVKNYRLQGFYHAQNATGLFFVNAQTATPVQNIVIDNVKISYTVGGSCTATNGAGCRTDVLQFNPRTQNVNLDGFAFTNSFVSNLTTQAAFPFNTGTTLATSVKAANINISNNEFINVQGTGAYWYHAFIALPVGPIAGTNAVIGNKIVRGTTGVSYAVSWNGATTTGSAGNLRVANNYMNGFNGTSVHLINTGDVNVEKNTFGARSASQARPAITEEARDGGTQLIDNAGNSNGRVNTWYPSADAKVLTEEAPPGVVTLASPLADDIPSCVATLDVAAPTAAPLPASTVDLDVYWTQDRSAEIYLGRASGVGGASAKLVLNLPVGPQEFPSTVVGTSDIATIVNKDTGIAGGYLRMQTVATESGQSSQYSRTVGFTGSCLPELTINQAANQNDSTLARDLHYTVVSSLPLDPTSVTAAVVDVTAAAVPNTVDEARLNPRSVSVTPVAGTANREFDVIARVDDSSKVTAAIAAGKVTSAGGLSNREAAVSTDPDITFVNPIATKPSSFTLVTGEPDGKKFGFEVASGAPTPKSDLEFTSVPDQAAVDNQVELSITDAMIKAGETKSQQVRVTAAAGDVAANTPVTVTHTVVSSDSNYHGLLVQSNTIKLFSTDPSIKITKRAFVGSTDTSSPAQIMATGTEALSGTRLTDGQAVCFVYEVLNTSADDWATVLTDVMVTDTDTRLGTNGVIGTIPKIEIGASVRLSACAALIPVDTTVSVP